MPATAHEVSFGVVQNFIAIDVAMIVRRWYRQRMVIEKSRHKRTDHKIVRLECLMYWRWLMNAACYGFEFVN